MGALEELEGHRAVCALCEAWFRSRLTVLLADVLDDMQPRGPMPVNHCETGARLYARAFESTRDAAARARTGRA